MRHKNIDSLTISNFTAPRPSHTGDDSDSRSERSGWHSESEFNFREEEDSEDSTFNLDALANNIAKIGSIRHLTVSDVNVNCAEGDYGEDGPEFRVDNLSLCFQNTKFRQGFLASISELPLCYSNISYTDITHESMPMVHDLQLEGIYNCDAAFCRALKLIATYCEPLRRCLYLIDRPEFTVKGLKAMVTKRLEFVSAESDSEDEDEEETRVEGDDDSDAQSVVVCSDTDDMHTLSGFEEKETPPRELAFKTIAHLEVKGHPNSFRNATGSGLNPVSEHSVGSEQVGGGSFHRLGV
ncbi:hypothetical protein NLJ89_g989 [Agrocybe chaxingu]|uniref:Uncharacterized protein n=1 Tax=Agrocybe chaxingu TaxID=84603 RepID=A0A9W8N0T7_9AGAR|nr:hypothetical protein NLJ89_g989 [Agrocybe chaxingu]